MKILNEKCDEYHVALEKSNKMVITCREHLARKKNELQEMTEQCTSYENQYKLLQHDVVDKNILIENLNTSIIDASQLTQEKHNSIIMHQKVTETLQKEIDNLKKQMIENNNNHEKMEHEAVNYFENEISNYVCKMTNEQLELLISLHEINFMLFFTLTIIYIIICHFL